MKLLLPLLLLLVAPLHADDKTRGIGIYPGRQTETYAPAITVGAAARHNLSLFHKVYHSSSYDYNLTGQLITDGITTTTLPAYVEVFANGQPLPKDEREVAFDGSEWNKTVLGGEEGSYCIRWYGMAVEVDSLVLNGTCAYHADRVQGGYTIMLSDGNDTLGVDEGSALPGREWGITPPDDPNKQSAEEFLPVRNISTGFAFPAHTLTTLTVDMSMAGVEYWAISDIQFFYKGHAVDHALLPMSTFESVWRSATGGEQWVYVDLGAASTIDTVSLAWLRTAPQGRIEVSNDAVQWTTIATLPTQALSYDVPVAGIGQRYVRVVVDGQDEPYMLSEMTVWGTGGTRARAASAARAEGNTLSLAGGDWLLQRATAVSAAPQVLSSAAYTPTDWLVATVPATVLTSYINAQAVQEPNYDDNNQYLSESYFNAPFYYRRTFRIPKSFAKRQLFLNLDGINWKARLWLNGQEIGRVDGAFMRGKIDITALVADENVLLVEIEPTAHPGATKEKNYIFPRPNGGLLGMDNPTFHASVGWDWIPTVRGREIGIWSNIFLTAESGISLADPFVSTTLTYSPDTLVTLTPTVRYDNTSDKTVTGTLHAWIGDISVDEEVSLAKGEGVLTLLPTEHAALHEASLRLWWPNGYGEAALYDAGFALIDTATGDTLSAVRYAYGAREITYEDVDTALKIFVNGRRIIPKGGNWGFSEQNLRYRQREYDIAVRNHHDMNFNMIRNWVAQTADEAFYAACDRYGILVWQDFCLANPADGPDPADEALFERNALDYVYRIRSHPSVALYCGRNEGYPPARIDRYLRAMTAAVHPGIVYISSSADDGVSGHGPYNALPAKEYFSRQTGLLHSERGMPCIMTNESLRRALRQQHLWPQGDVWGQHDYTMTGAQKGASFNDLIAARWGMPSAQSARFMALGEKAFATYAQLINYEGYRAMFEACSRDRMGLLLWMSHPCWPSLSWQCYDYYFEPTGAYYGCKKACEPLHIQYNALTGEVEVVNSGVGDKQHLRAVVAVYDLAGQSLYQTEQTVAAPDDSTTPLTDVFINDDSPVLRLSLYDEEEHLVSQNTYILAGDLSSLGTAAVEYAVAPTVVVADGKERMTTVTLTNSGTQTAYLLRLTLLDDTGEEILPVWYTDNYFHLLPAETATVEVRWAVEDQRTESTTLRLTGLNLSSAE